MFSAISIKVQFLTPSARLPVLSSPCSVGYDMFPAQPAVVEPFDRALIPTNLALEIPVSTRLAFRFCIPPF